MPELASYLNQASLSLDFLHVEGNEANDVQSVEHEYEFKKGLIGLVGISGLWV
jgi:hypothetical protein